MRILKIAVGALGLASCLIQAQVANLTPQTPLIGALIRNEMAEAERLLVQGADPNEGRFAGFPPLFLVVVRQDLHLFRLMAAKGADLTVRDGSGATALMWAAFSETGDPNIVSELLERGADPLAANKAGETALTWALRRGETPVVQALRKAGASDAASIRTAVQSSLALLQKSGAQFVRVSGCVSCHHQSLPQMALAAGRTRGIDVDEMTARDQVDATIALMKPLQEEMVQNRYRVPNPPISASYLLVGLGASNYAPDAVTRAMATMIAAWQHDDGGFYGYPAIRPPLEASDFTATALSLRALQLYGEDPAQRVARARDWLRSAKPRTNEDRAMQLLGLGWAKASPEDLRSSAQALLAEQRPDGGWAQLAGLESDAYATGQSLVALHWAGEPVVSPAYQRGVAFLMRTRFADGSWLVRSRTYPLQRLKDSGFPHGKDQWISAAGTSWAAMALSLALETKPLAPSLLTRESRNR